MDKPRRRYNSVEAVIAALNRTYDAVWKKYIETTNPPSMVYHYCRHDALCRIVRSGNLWASDVLNMNDPEEVTYAFQCVVAPVIAQMNQGGTEGCYLDGTATAEVIRSVCSTWCTHIACFSATDALPAQWRNYAGGTGCAIGFDRRGLTKWCLDRNVALFPVNYALSLQRTLVREYLSRERMIELDRLSGKAANIATVHEVRKHANKYLHSLTMSMKSEEWRDEQEWRLLIIQSEGHERFQAFERPEGICCFELPILVASLVREIVLSPRYCADPNELRSLLDSSEMSSVVIRPSQCEF